ncbi:MAG: AraC family transcriptional regulator [Planctomycetota bacterium]
MDISQIAINHPCGSMLTTPGWCRDRATSLALRDQELWLVWRGRGWMSDGEHRWELAPGFCVWMRPGGVYDAGTSERDPLGISYIHFDGRFSSSPPEFFTSRNLSLVDATMRRIIEGVSRRGGGEVGEPADAGVVERTLLVGVLHDLVETASQSGGSRLASVYGPIAASIRHHPGDATPVAEWARQLGVSSAHFSRSFRDYTGQSPQAFRITARIERARGLLTESASTVAEIAETLGYADAFVFSKQFKQHVGVSPSAYRRRGGAS